MGLSDLLGVLKNYSGATAQSAPATTNQDFGTVAQSIPQNHLASGLAEAFQSNQTPPFPEMLGNLFNQSDGQQRAGILGKLLSAAGPAGAGTLSQFVPGIGQNTTQVNPEQTGQIPPAAVQQLAEQAQKNNPSIVDEASQFYSQHPQVVQALGAGALAMIMSHISQRV